MDFNYKSPLSNESFITFIQSFFITQITNPLVLETNQFVSENQPVLTKGFESKVHYNVDEFQVLLGYTFVDARRKYYTNQSFVPLTPKHKINIDIIYEVKNNYSVAFEGYYISSMLRDFDTKTKEYYTVGLIAQKYFKHFMFIANCENLFDLRQTRFENIVLPPIDNPTFRQVYAPLDGRVFNVTLKLNL